MATQDSPSLYERLGGVYSIATVVDDLIDRVMIDPRLPRPREVCWTSDSWRGKFAAFGSEYFGSLDSRAV